MTSREDALASEGHRRIRALIVDQDECNLVLATEALTSFGAGFDVATARSIEEARTWVRTFDPELVLLDEAFSGLATDLERVDPGEPRKLVLVSSGPVLDSCPPYSAVLAKPITLGSLLGVTRRLSFN